MSLAPPPESVEPDVQRATERGWERRAEVAGLQVRWFEAPSSGAPPVLYVHGVPTCGEEFLPFLERAPGIAPDLPGFGGSDKPADFDYSIDGYASFLREFADTAGLERFSLFVHDWGAVGLALAQQMPERVDRVVISNAVPFLPGYRWHRVARVWRTPLAGEVLMGLTFRAGLGLTLTQATVRDGSMPEWFLDLVWRHFDHGTQRAILKLYRSAPSERLAAAGAGLGELRCPALVLWGTGDPYLPAPWADGYAGALGGETTLELVEAGHWPWVDRPELIDRITAFLG